MGYVAKYQRKWLKKNPEYMKEWRKKNKEKILEYHKKWAEEHPGYMYESVKASRKKKPEYYKEQKRLYARRKRLEEKLKKEIYEVKEMKFRNRGKHGFKRLKRQAQVREYCLRRIKANETFSVLDIANDLGVARTTVIGILQELSEKDKDFIYQRGYIKILNVGDNGIGKIAEDNKGLKVRRMGNNRLKKLQKKANIYGYLQTLTKEGNAIPPMKELMRELKELYGITDCQGNICKLLQELEQEDKIIYKNGKVLAVNLKDVKSDTGKTLKYVKQEEPVEEEIMEEPEVLEEPELIEEPTECVMEITDSEKFDKAVKELVVDYLNNADITTREEVVSYVDALYKITDKLKDKLY